ncbi:hypothetical protein [Leifsonia naganoensis]|uniref:Uncharacterized protein n=1 Tax=Leifsonia naganoensis TaxID=150025 RepID=A0A853DMH0_9MICO|nr:hypothetical protein [Leifsonia naganoensis]NYK09648.1 hypothetical protein [Leifsonia naganoensis]
MNLDSEDQAWAEREQELRERIWPAFESMDIVLEANSQAGTLLIVEPGVENAHQMRVSFTASQAVADWDDLLNEPIAPRSRVGISDVDFIVGELCRRLWEASVVVSSVVHRLVYERGYFEGVVEPDLPPSRRPTEGLSLRWEIDRSDDKGEPRSQR